LRNLRAADAEPSRILFVDVISFGIPHRGARQIAPKGTGTIHRALQQSGPPIHVFSGLVRDGRLSPFFAIINRKKEMEEVLELASSTVILLGKTKRRGERGVLAFLEEMVSRRTLVVGDILVTDNDRRWKTPEVLSYLAAYGIRALRYPTYVGAKLDPCDNSFHASLRRRYNTWQLQKVDMTLNRRLQVLSDVYLSTPTEAVLGCIRRCGVFEANPEHTMAELLSEGRRQMRGNAAAFRHHVDAYNAYLDDTNWAEEDEAQVRERGDLGDLLAERADS
jgi:hypothetical protein